jgi:hypothetical protein
MIDLATWNLTIPVGNPAVTIETSELVAGYEDNYFKTPSGNVYFWVPVEGATTENADYPRSELRETYKDGDLRNWTIPSADHFLGAGLKIHQVPSTGKVVIGQIHVKDSSQPMLKVEYQYKSTSRTGNIVAKVRQKPGATIQVYTIATGIPLNERFTYLIHLTPKGTLGVAAGESAWSTKLDSTWTSKSLYFKAGIYPQDNDGDNEAGSATFDKLRAEHRPL